MFISPAFAADASTSVAEPGLLSSMLPLLLVFFIFYFLIIRPQNKRMNEHRNMINALKKGDKVVTGGGIVGTVKKLVGDEDVEIEISKDVKITAVRSTLMNVRNKK